MVSEILGPAHADRLTVIVIFGYCPRSDACPFVALCVTDIYFLYIKLSHVQMLDVF